MHTLWNITLIDLAVCGDPVICRALVLVLQGPEYNARFLPASSLDEVRTLEDVQILLLAPGWVTERREASLTELGGLMSKIKMPTLELVAAFEERGERRRLPAWSDRRVHWPCSTDELKRHIRATVESISNMDGGFVAGVK